MWQRLCSGTCGSLSVAVHVCGVCDAGPVMSVDAYCIRQQQVVDVMFASVGWM